MKRCFFAVASFGLLTGMLSLSASRGQSPSDVPVIQTVQVGPAGLGGGSDFDVRVAPGTRTRSEIGRLVGELRDATEDAKKTEITKKLEAAVTKFFDEDQKARETDLAKLEERLKKLRAQLDRRSKAKADIIQLQLKVLVNEAEGLGFLGTPLFDAPGGGMALPPYGGFGPAAAQPAAVPLPGARP